MKKTILSAAMIMAAHSMFAQVDFAPEIGMNFTKISSEDQYGAKNFGVESVRRLKFGGSMNFFMNRALFIQVGAFYTQKGFNRVAKETLGGDTYEIFDRVNENAIEIPLNIGCKIGLGKAGSLFLTMGPYWSQLVAANERVGLLVNKKLVDSAAADLQIGSGKKDEIKRTDIGMNFSAGYQSPIGVFVRAQYGTGFKNILPDATKGTDKNKVYGLSIGYILKISK